MAKTYYTTSEAARVLAVSPDTVLKWVRAGKITSYRTPGGHSRIPIEAVKALLPEHSTALFPEPNHLQNFRYCWDFNAGPNGISNECLDCIAYRSRARRCYEMRDLPEQYGHHHLHCEYECEECDYYHLAQELSTAILMVSRSREWMDRIKERSQDSELQIESALNEYECSALIEKFRPDYIVVDCSYGVARTRNLCTNLTKDIRIPYTRIILTSKTARVKGYCESAVFGWLRKPFRFEELAACIGKVREPSLTASSGQKKGKFH